MSTVLYFVTKILQAVRLHALHLILLLMIYVVNLYGANLFRLL